MEKTMKIMAAKDAKNHFGELIDTAQREPVSIQKHGRPVAVLVSAERYSRLEKEHLQTKISKGFSQIDKGEYSDQSVLEVLEETLQKHNEKIQAGSTS